MTVQTWANDNLHSVKRSLSVYEKSSITPQIASGSAIVMPAVPKTEIEELLAFGFNPRFIHAIEADQELADRLHGYYWDEVSVYLEEISVWLQRSKSTNFSYCHLDFCGHLKDQEKTAIVYALKRLDAQSRLRVSLLVSRKQEDQHDHEAYITFSTLGNIFSACIEMSEIYAPDLTADFNLYKQQILEYARNTFDPTYALTGIVLVNRCFGIDWKEYADQCATAKPYIPEKFQSIFTNIQRFEYREEGGYQTMSTAWFDFRKILELEQNYRSILIFLHRVGKFLSCETVRYNLIQN